jgi:hypothetical protein
VLVMLLEESLKSETELEEVSSQHTGLVGQWFASIWLIAVLISLSAESIESGDSNTTEVLEISL